MSGDLLTRSTHARWGLFLFLLVWGLGYIAWFIHLVRSSHDFIVVARAQAVCARPDAHGIAATSFGFNAEEVDRNMLAGGWGEPESWGVWNGERKATLVLPLPQSISAQSARLKLDLLLPSNEKFPLLPVRVYVEGKQIQRLMLRHETRDEPQFLDLPSELLRDKRCVTLDFEFERAYRPLKEHINKDARLLALGLKRASWMDRVADTTSEPAS